MTLLYFNDLTKEQADDIASYALAQGVGTAEYANILEKRWCDDLNFCSCGKTEQAQAHLKKVLAAFRDKYLTDEKGKDFNYDSVDIAKVIKSDVDSLYYFMLYTLEAMNLTTHGSCIDYSWLTPEGETFLAEMEAVACSKA